LPTGVAVHPSGPAEKSNASSTITGPASTAGMAIRIATTTAAKPSAAARLRGARGRDSPPRMAAASSPHAASPPGSGRLITASGDVPKPNIASLMHSSPNPFTPLKRNVIEPLTRYRFSSWFWSVGDSPL